MIGTGTTADWQWIAAQPVVCHIVQAWDSTPTSTQHVFGSTTFLNPGGRLFMYGAGADRTVGGGAAATNLYPGANTCWSGVTMTDPTIISYQIAGLGANELTVRVNGIACRTTTVTAYSISSLGNLGFPNYFDSGLTIGSEMSEIWCDSSTAAGSAAAMTARADAALVSLAATYGVTLP